MIPAGDDAGAGVLRPTGPVTGLALAAAVLLALPIVGLVVMGGLGSLGAAVTSDAVLTSLRLTLVTSTVATALAVVLGVPVALAAERGGGLLRRVAVSAGEVPLVLPPVVVGLGLLLAFGREGLLGGALDAASLRITFTSTAVVIAQVVVAMPLVVLAVRAGITALSPGPELAAAVHGATPRQVLWTATLPGLRPAILRGAALAWGRAAGEFGATLTFAGSLPGTTRTLPLEVYAELQTDPRLAAATALVQVGVAVLALALARRLEPGAG